MSLLNMEHGPCSAVLLSSLLPRPQTNSSVHSFANLCVISELASPTHVPKQQMHKPFGGIHCLHVMLLTWYAIHIGIGNRGLAASPPWMLKLTTHCSGSPRAKLTAGCAGVTSPADCRRPCREQAVDVRHCVSPHHTLPGQQRGHLPRGCVSGWTPAQPDMLPSPG